MKSSRSLDKLFEQASDDLAILITRTRQLKRLTNLFRSHLEQDLASHCYLSNVKEAELTVYVDSAAWATRLRFQVPQLLPILRRTNPIFSKLQAVRVKILTPDNLESNNSVKSTGPTMSIDNSNAINSLSETIEDPELQIALQRLARHAKKK